MRQYFTITDTGEPVVELASLEDVKTELGITDDTEDAWLELSITRISKAFADYCDRIFALTDITEVFVFDYCETFKARQPLLLSQYPIVGTPVATVDGVTADDLEWDVNTGRLWRIDGAWAGRVEVGYTGGYDLPDDAPSALQWALIEAIRQRRSFSGVDPTVRSTTHGDTSVTFNSEPVQGAAGFSRIIIDAINPYKRIAI